MQRTGPARCRRPSSASSCTGATWADEWGVNRSVSQIHALLYLSERPLTAEDIAATLGLARSNVSNSLKELPAWNLIRRVPIKGDRREHFEAETDIWEMLLRIAARPQGARDRSGGRGAAGLRRRCRRRSRVDPVAAAG